VLAAQALAAHQDEWIGCDLAQTSCVAPFIAWMGKRAFRRPLSEPVEDSLIALYEQARGEWGAAKAVELVLTAMLDSPYFLYHLEPTLGDAGAEVVPLDGHEVASRLSYFLWGSMPDDDLTLAADTGVLATVEGIEAEAKRMLSDARASEAVDTFARQWLELELLAEQVKDPDVFPSYDEALVADMEAETLTFVRDIVETGTDAATLLTATHTWATPALAALYGVTHPGGAGMKRVDLDPETRAGLLTQASLLSSRAHAAETSWVLRGKFVREKLLCETLPPPPPGVDQKAANDPDRLSNPECKSCHLQMDPVGVGFENYNAIGGHLDEGEDGEPIVAAGEVMGHPDIGKFVGVVDLAGKLAKSDAVQRCLATQYFRYAGRRDDSDDNCSIDAALQRFQASGRDIRELILGIAVSDAFRHATPARQD
jgi:hypothetical protein